MTPMNGTQSGTDDAHPETAPKQSTGTTRTTEAPSVTEFDLLGSLKENFRLTFQQIRQVTEWIEDCRTWGEETFEQQIAVRAHETGIKGERWTLTQKRDWLFNKLREDYRSIQAKEKEYQPGKQKRSYPRYQVEDHSLKGNLLRLCPAASERAVCCNLKTLNLVENCAMECSYCVLQNHYDEPVIKLPDNLQERLEAIRIPANQRLRICTGEYSDSLLWGNHNGMLDHLCAFAAKHTNIILEFKTKTANIGYFLKNEVPPNICCSWSLNPQIVVDNEEHKTAPLEKRLEAARTVADKGIKVGFHFHPMMYFKGWREAYGELFQRVLGSFSAEEVLWVSLGTVTLLKGVMQQNRKSGRPSKILQMDGEWTPDGKWTYSFDVRKQLYQNALDHLRPWKGKVFTYLCMEHKPMWDAVMDYTYKSIPEMDEAFNDSAFAKLP